MDFTPPEIVCLFLPALTWRSLSSFALTCTRNNGLAVKEVKRRWKDIITFNLPPYQLHYYGPAACRAIVCDEFTAVTYVAYHNIAISAVMREAKSFGIHPCCELNGQLPDFVDQRQMVLEGWCACTLFYQCRAVVLGRNPPKRRFGQDIHPPIPPRRFYELCAPQCRESALIRDLWSGERISAPEFMQCLVLFDKVPLGVAEYLASCDPLGEMRPFIHAFSLFFTCTIEQ